MSALSQQRTFVRRLLISACATPLAGVEQRESTMPVCHRPARRKKRTGQGAASVFASRRLVLGAARYVCFGSQADVTLARPDIRYYPKAGDGAVALPQLPARVSAA